MVPWPGYASLADPMKALDFEQAEGVARLDHGFPSGMRSAWAVASLEVFEQAGWDWVHERAAHAGRLAGASNLADRGLEVLPAEPLDAGVVEVGRPRGRGGSGSPSENVIVRYIPAFGVVRASVGAWSSEQELDRLVGLARCRLSPLDGQSSTIRCGWV